MTERFHELDTVVLVRDLPDTGLRRGDLGAIVMVYADEAVEVEFVTASGRTQQGGRLRLIEQGDGIDPIASDREDRCRWRRDGAAPANMVTFTVHGRLDHERIRSNRDVERRNAATVRRAQVRGHTPAAAVVVQAAARRCRRTLARGGAPGLSAAV